MNSSSQFDYSSFPFPFHSVLVSHHGKLIQEEYIRPCTETTLHRMFSIAKSYTALAVCALAAEGKISLQDHIIDYFKDYTPAQPHPWLAEMTIQDMLDMRTCHKTTTYKIDPSVNWVKSFFTTPPDHRSGQIFKYDTGAAHTLAALVKRISGTGVLDYLRTVYLQAIGFSKRAYFLTDPFGDEIGGSGLMATPQDLMVTAQFLMPFLQNKPIAEGPYMHDQYDASFYQRYGELIRQCMSKRSATLHEGKTTEECQGYGSQFWMIRNGVMMYGLGGQYMAFFSKEDLIIVTTADTQSLQGATQIILDEMQRVDAQFRNEADACAAKAALPEKAETYGDASLMEQALGRYCGTYRFLPNASGFCSIEISRQSVILFHKDYRLVLPISLSEPAETTDPVYGQTLYVLTSPLFDGGLYQHIQILDEYVGCIRLLIHGGSDRITVYLRKIEESLYPEIGGFLEAERLWVHALTGRNENVLHQPAKRFFNACVSVFTTRLCPTEAFPPACGLPHRDPVFPSVHPSEYSAFRKGSKRLRISPQRMQQWTRPLFPLRSPGHTPDPEVSPEPTGTEKPAQSYSLHSRHRHHRRNTHLLPVRFSE